MKGSIEHGLAVLAAVFIFAVFFICLFLYAIGGYIRDKLRGDKNKNFNNRLKRYDWDSAL